MTLPDSETIQNLEVPPSIHDLREGIIDIFEAGVNGTDEKIPEAIKHERGAHTAATLLGYSQATFKSLQLFGASLMRPEEFELKHLQNGEVLEIETGDIIYTQGDPYQDGSVAHIYNSPISAIHQRDPLAEDHLSTNLITVTEGTNPYTQPKRLIAKFTHTKPTRLDEIDRKNPRAFAERLALCAERDINSNDGDDMHLTPSRQFLLNFHLIPERLNEDIFLEGMFRNTRFEKFLDHAYLKDFRQVGGFDIGTIAFDREKTAKYINNRRGGSKDTIKAYNYWLSQLPEDPAVSIVGVGKMGIGDQFYYAYTAKERPQVRVKQEERKTIHSLIPDLSGLIPKKRGVSSIGA